MRIKPTNWQTWVIYVISIFLLAILIFKWFDLSSSRLKPSNQVSEPITLHQLDIVIGDEAAQTKLFLFFNYNCSYCRRFFNEALDILQMELINDGKLAIVLKPVEIEQQVDVMYALQTGVCLNKHGSFKEFHELLLYNPMVVYTEEFKELVDGYIDANTDLAECLLANTEYSYLKKNLLDFYKNNMTATPTFVINNNIYKGFKDAPTLMKIIRKELK